MEISVDGHQRRLREIPETIGELIDELKESIIEEDRVILGVCVDGTELDIAAQRDIARKASVDFSSVTIATADARELCVATLEEAARHIQPVVDESLRVSELIDAGRKEEALSRIIPCVEVWSTLIAAVQKVSILLELDLNEVVADDATLAEVIGELAEILRALKANIDAHDTVAVRDAMKFEMPEIAGKLDRQLEALSSAVSAS